MSFEELVTQIKNGTLPMSEERRALAQAAVESMSKRKNENVHEWAETLSKSVAHADD